MSQIEDPNEEFINLDWLQPELDKMPDAPKDAEASREGFKIQDKDGDPIDLNIDSSIPVEESIKNAERQLLERGLPQEVIDKVKEAIVKAAKRDMRLLDETGNFAQSPAFSYMIDGAPWVRRIMQILGHNYHTLLSKVFMSDDGLHASIPACACEIELLGKAHNIESTDDEGGNHPDGAPPDFLAKQSQFISATREFQDAILAVAILCFSIGREGSSHIGEDDSS